MKYKIITSILFAILFQTNAVYVSAQILNSTDNKELGTKRNASYNLEEIKVRWKKAALENCTGVPCVTTTPTTPSSGACPTSTITDIDGNIYNTVSIGTQCWTKENLRTTKYTDGTAIPLNSTGGVAGNDSGEDWTAQTTGQRSIFAQNSGNLSNFGFLYNGFAVRGVSSSGSNKKLCPTGWNVPTESEWELLWTFLGGDNVAGGKMKSTSSLWFSPNTAATDESGFSALPGGYREGSPSFGQGGRYRESPDYAYFWGSTVDPTTPGDYFYFYIHHGGAPVSDSYGSEEYGFSVRCIKTQFVP
ncbi:MAG: fibrobacter succinogenes major paralogous domain-containing protein [Saprospiraceae bacterium]|nr:fibrobacter succinogenes major paralogous domain-containing protein [Saprospiraceae bacterium]